MVWHMRVAWSLYTAVFLEGLRTHPLLPRGALRVQPLTLFRATNSLHGLKLSPKPQISPGLQILSPHPQTLSAASNSFSRATNTLSTASNFLHSLKPSLYRLKPPYSPKPSPQPQTFSMASASLHSLKLSPQPQIFSIASNSLGRATRSFSTSSNCLHSLKLSLQSLKPSPPTTVCPRTWTLQKK